MEESLSSFNVLNEGNVRSFYNGKMQAVKVLFYGFNVKKFFDVFPYQTSERKVQLLFIFSVKVLSSAQHKHKTQDVGVEVGGALCW